LKSNNNLNSLTCFLNRVLRKGMVHSPSSKTPYYYVVEHPKSGGTWVGQMLADYFDIPFPRNTLPKLGSQILHCHEQKIYGNNKKIIAVIRDGRDVMVSYYYHSFFENDLYNQEHVKRVKKELKFHDYHDVENNMSKFIEFLYDKNYYPLMTWSAFTHNWINNYSASIVRYEDLLVSVPDELGSAIEKITNKAPDRDKLIKIEKKFSFNSMKSSLDEKSSETKWLRKGVSGDWKNNFDRKSRIIFDQLAGDILIESGYEKDHSWVG
jgi:hypothetical protein